MSSGKDRLTRHQALAAFERSRVLGGYAQATLDLERRVLRASLPRLGRRSLARVSRSDVEAFLAKRTREVSATSVSRELGTLRAFFGFLAREGLLPGDPTEGLTTRPGTHRPPLFLSRESVAKLLATALIEQPSHRAHRSAEARRAIALRDRALLELLYGLGLRASEACHARTTDLDLRDGNLLVRRAKRGGHRLLPLPPAALPQLQRYLRDGRPHLLRGSQDQGRLLLTARGNPLVGNHVLRVVRQIGERAGLRAHPHALRRAVATHLVQAGVSIPAVSDLLGHARLDTTQLYLVVGRDDLRRAVEALEQKPSEGGPDEGASGGAESLSSPNTP